MSTGFCSPGNARTWWRWWAASNGDRSENADYQCGKRRLRQIDGRIRFLTKRIEAAEVVDPELILKAPRIKLLTSEHCREFVISDELLGKMLAHKDCTELLTVLIPFLIDTGFAYPKRSHYAGNMLASIPSRVHH
jgi:hypothetical protein